MGHVEVVLAFIMFVSAVIFILSFVNVGNDTDAGEATLTSVSSILQNQAQARVIIHSVLINTMSGNPPRQTPAIIIVELPEEITTEQKLRVEAVTDSNPLRLPAQKHPTNAQQIVIDRGGNEVTLVRVILSDAITATPASLAVPAHEPSSYRLLSRSETTMIAEANLRSLASSYARDYPVFKEELGVGKRTNLGFGAVWYNPERGEQDFIKAERDIPTRVDVTAQNARQELLLQDGQRIFADVSIKTW